MLSKIAIRIKQTTEYIFAVLTLLLCLLLTACQTTAPKEFNPYPLLHDELFPLYSKIQIEDKDDVFHIGQSATSFVDKLLLRAQDSDHRIETLANAINKHTEFNLLYKNDANTIASETFDNKAANCLSLTIMTFAMADYANIGVKFQQVDIPELWVRRDGYSLLNLHVNLRLYQKNELDVILYHSKSYQLDFDRRAQSLRLPVKTISKNRVLAMFYNNKGADALIKDDYNTAYAYFRSALVTDHFLVEAWTNLGLLYRHSGQIEYAENVYLQALQINGGDLTTLENLAYVYHITSRKAESKKIKALVLRQRAENPFYHYMLGNVEYDNKNWLKAIEHYKKSIRLNKLHDEFYFSIAKSYYQLGDFKNSKKYVKLAKRHTYDDSQQAYYQSKLDNLSNLN